MQADLRGEQLGMGGSGGAPPETRVVGGRGVWPLHRHGPLLGRVGVQALIAGALMSLLPPIGMIFGFLQHEALGLTAVEGAVLFFSPLVLALGSEILRRMLLRGA